MKVKLKKHCCIITREKGDKAYHGVVNAAGESALLYNAKKILNAKGHNFIKVRMNKDGHLVDEYQQYLIDRKSGIAIFSPFFAIRGAEEDYNKGEVVLSVENLLKGG